MNHRGLQRALFRMQMHPAFAARVFAREAAALGELDLDAEERALLLALEPAAVSADAHDRRKDQLLGNLATEYGLSAVVGPDGLLADFLASAEFHAAIRADERLPLAFGRFAARVAAEQSDAELAAIVRLELAMATTRRAEEPDVPAPGELRLAPNAALARLPEGTLAWAASISAALAEGRARPTGELGPGREVVLLLATRGSVHALPDVAPERLEPAVAALLTRAEAGLDGAACDALARELGATREEVDAFAASLVDDGVLVRG